MERTYELASRAAGPLASHVGPFVASLIDQQFAASVVYIKIQHALAFDRWLAAVLAQSRCLPGRARIETTAADDLVARYGQHLHDQQGLAIATIDRYRTVAGQFLRERFGRSVVDLRALRAGDVIAFVPAAVGDACGSYTG